MLPCPSACLGTTRVQLLARHRSRAGLVPGQGGGTSCCAEQDAVRLAGSCMGSLALTAVACTICIMVHGV